MRRHHELPFGAEPTLDVGDELAIYELHVGTFSDTGDLAGAIRRLDALVELGITAVEIMPVAQFPGRRNWGCDGVQLYALVPRLAGIRPGGDFRVLGPSAVRVERRLGDGSKLCLLANFADAPVRLATPPPDEEGLLYCSGAAAPTSELKENCAAFYRVPAEAAPR